MHETSATKLDEGLALVDLWRCHCCAGQILPHPLGRAAARLLGPGLVVADRDRGELVTSADGVVRNESGDIAEESLDILRPLGQEIVEGGRSSIPTDYRVHDPSPPRGNCPRSSLAWRAI